MIHEDLINAQFNTGSKNSFGPEQYKIDRRRDRKASSWPGTAGDQGVKRDQTTRTQGCLVEPA